MTTGVRYRKMEAEYVGFLRILRKEGRIGIFMTKQETYDYLRANGVEFEITEHAAVYNMAECAELALPYPEDEAKNLFVRDDKKRSYYLITVRGEKRVDLKEFRRAHGTRSLSFASPEELLSFLKLTPGSVTPLGLLNDEDCRVQFYLDEDFLLPPGRIGVHPNDNTATIWLQTQELLRVIRAHGTSVTLCRV